MKIQFLRILGTIALSVILSASVTEAALYESDSFDYADGSLDGQSGGTGWDGAWSCDSGAGIEIVTNSQLFASGVSSQHGLGERYLSENWAGEANGAPSDVVYISWRAKLANDTYRSFQLGLTQNTGSGDANRLNIGQDDTSLNEIRAQIGSTQYRADEEDRLYFDGLNTFTFILKVTDGGGGAADSFALYVNSSSTTEPATPYLTGSGLIMNFNKIRFFAGNIKDANAAAQGIFDDIKVGTTWTDVYMEPIETTDYGTWVLSYNLAGSDAAETNDYDGDGIINILEYAQNGDPTNAANSGSAPMLGQLITDNGTNWVEYIHTERTAGPSTLIYTIESTEGLTTSDFTNSVDAVLAGEGAAGDYKTVTNRIPMTGKSSEFLRLKIDY